MADNNNDVAFNVDLEGLFEQISEILVNPASFSKSACSFLFLLWGYFEIFIMDDESGEGDGTITTANTTMPTIIQVEKGYAIFDYGSSLKTSSGKYYGNYATGRLLTTVKAMVDLLMQRSAKCVRFAGLPAAERVAWLECKKYNVNTSYQPDEKAQLLQSRIKELDRFREVVYSLSAKK